MLVTYRLAGLSALEGRYAGVSLGAQCRAAAALRQGLAGNGGIWSTGIGRLIRRRDSEANLGCQWPMLGAVRGLWPAEWIRLS
jgi:hypothetical protein